MPTSKRPCRICRHWFEPDPRVGQRHRVCDRAECQRERHRQNCVRGREADRKEERDELLKKRFVVIDDGAAATAGAEVLGSAPRDLVAAGMTVRVRELLKILGPGPRDLVTPKMQDERRVRPKVAPVPPRDATDGGGPSP